MAENINTNINVDINVAEALGKLRSLEKQIQLFNKNIVQGTAQARGVQNDFNSSLIHNINATGKFTASMGKIHTETERFTNALEKSKFSAREYFRYSMASTKTFGRLFGKEFGTISKVAEQRVKELQARHIELGRSADGAMRSVKILPKSLDYSKASTSMQLAIQKQQIFNKLLDTGTTKLLNFGKNTQWAGRQLMVGFTIPLSILGASAIRTFKDMESQAIRFKKVYGDMFTATSETDAALANIKNLANEFTKYGISVADTIRLAADAAAAGNAGKQLESVVTQATKLSVLGEVTQEQALDATIAIQNAFGITGKELEDTINFLNAVENQTVVALKDITEAIPKVASVVSVLGGDIKDLAVYMAAMKEGGIQATDGANALKTSLGRLINPTKAAVEMSGQLGINLKAIVDENAGDLSTIMLTFAEAIKPLDDLAKARLMEKVFGKFQFARMTTLFNNLGKSGTQASRVLDLVNESTEALAMTAERELGVTASSSAVKFQASIEKLKASLAPIGQAFAEALTPIIEFVTKALEKFNNFSDGTKKTIVTLLAVLGGIGPVLLMTIGLVANGIANIGKGINLLRKGYQNIVLGSGEVGNATNYMTMEQLEALSVANNLHGAHKNLTNQFALETGALIQLTSVYRQASVAAAAFAKTNPGMMLPGSAKALKTPKFGKPPMPMAKGGFVPGTGNKDTVPAVLMPGEFVVRKDAAQANSQTLKQMNQGGGTYRSKGTPAFEKMQYRGGGTRRKVDDRSQIIRDQTENNRISTWNTKAAELEAIKRAGLSGKDLTSVQASHLGLEDPYRYLQGGKRYKSWEAKKLMADLGAVNNYSNTLRQMSDTSKAFMFDENLIQAAVRSTKKPRRKVLKIIKNIGRGMHVSTIDEIKIMREISSRHPTIASDPKGTRGAKRQARAVTAIADVRIENPDFYDTKKNRRYDPTRDAEVKSKQIKNAYVAPPKDFKSGKVRREQIKRGTAKFGKAAGLAVVGTAIFGGAAQGFNRSSGTPAYGEQGVTPAMLTPGEFVVNSQSAQKFGPQLQAMNKGGIAYRQNPSGPGYDPNNDFLWGNPDDKPIQPKKSKFKQATTKFGPNIEKAARITASATEKAAKITAKAIVQGAKNSANKFDKSQTGQNIAGWMDGKSKAEIQLENQLKKQTTKLLAQGKTLDEINEIQKDRKGLLQQVKAGDKEAIKAFKAQTKEQRMARKQQTIGKMNKASGVGFAISGAAMAYGMLAPEGAAGKDTANNISQIGFMVSGLLMMLPMFMSIGGALILGLGTLAGGLFLYNNMIKSAAKEGYKTAQSLGVTADELQKISQITGNTSSTMLAERQREGRVKNYNPIKSDFGPGFIESESGKELIKLTEELEKKGIDSAQVIANKLSTYVIDGLMTASDAESVAEALGRSINDRTYGIEVLGNLQDLIGINGRSLFDNPIEIRVKLIEEVEATSKDYINELGQDLNDLNMVTTPTLIDEILGVNYAFFKDMFRRGAVGKEKAREEGKSGFAVQLAGMKASTYGGSQLRSEITGGILGQQSMQLTMGQQIIDSAQIEFDTKRKQVQEEELLLQNALKSTTNAQFRLGIEQKLLEVAKKKAGIEKLYGDGIKKLVDMQKQALTDSVILFGRADDKTKKDLLGGTELQLRDKFKGTLNAPNVEEIIKLQKKLSPELSYKINLLVGSDQLNVGNAKRLLEAFQGDELALSARFELMVDKNGLESVDRTMTALSSIKDPEATKRLFGTIGSLAQEDYDDANVFLENAMGIPDAFMDLNDNTKNLLNAEEMAEAGKDIKKIEKDLKDLDKLSKEDRQIKILDFISDDSDFDALQNQAEYFKTLDDTSVKTFLTVFRSISEDYDPEQALQQYYQANPMSSPGSDAELEEWWLRNVAVPRAKRFVEIMKEIGLPGLDGEDIKEGGGKSLPIATKQLIELRMKGLDPAAASQLDFDSAARILNGSMKQQKEVIARLNAELRDAAIQSQLLMSDQELLENQMDATSNAIGAYISALQQTDIKTVQDQIDKYDELTKTQQEQLEKYQKGLEKLSDKENSINKVYNDRAAAIDKVSTANQRAEERQKQQINLASALTSGDFGAAAQAAAEMTSSAAGYQLEDTKAALEEKRQNDLKNLTVEINGILYTREQIETNINTIDEEIYQRSLLIKAEQQKIADIEKTITAEKEKQRKLQVLTQISQLSSQMAYTLDQTERQAISAQIGYLGQSVGLDMTSPESITNLSNQLGINAQSLVNSLATAQQIAGLTAEEFEAQFLTVSKRVKSVAGFMDETSVQGKNALNFMTNLKNTWAGDSKTGIGGLVSAGTSIKDNLIGAGAAIVAGKKALDDALAAANIALTTARSYQTTTVKRKYFGGAVGYMSGGKVKRYANGGNVNYKGSREPAPVRMAFGNIVPGIGMTDKVPALLTPGEFVVRKSVAQANMPLLNAINGNSFPSMGAYDLPQTSINSSTNVVSNISSPVYNYSVSVNVPNTSSSPNEIADVVINRIKMNQGREIRRNRF